MVKNMMKIVGIIFIVLLVVGIGILVYLCYRNLHWWEKDMKQIEKLGVVERRVTLPNGNDIIWFIENVIKQETVVSGHSNGQLFMPLCILFLWINCMESFKCLRCYRCSS